MRNADLPTRNAQGQVVSRPTSALDLHYLMSFYGDDSKFEPQRMLGAVVRSLLAEPGLTRDRILSVSKDDNGDKMSGSNLADAVEQVKFTPQALTVEELSRIWSIFYQIPYALSVAYIATVVTIESEEPVLAAQPVLQRGPFPQLDNWHIGEGDDDAARLRLPSYPSARLGTILTLRGRNLGGDSLVVQLVNQHLQSSVPDLPVTLTPGRAGEIKLSIPNANADAGKWLAGLYSVVMVATTGGVARSTNALPLPFAPQISAITAGARDGGDCGNLRRKRQRECIGAARHAAGGGDHDNRVEAREPFARVRVGVGNGKLDLAGAAGGQGHGQVRDAGLQVLVHELHNQTVAAEIPPAQRQDRSETGARVGGQSQSRGVVIALADVPVIELGERPELRLDALVVLPALQHRLGGQHGLLAFDGDDGGDVRHG